MSVKPIKRLMKVKPWGFLKYWPIRKGKSAKTVEFANGNVFADYNAKGELLSVEQVGPCDPAVFDRIAAGDNRVRDFLRGRKPLFGQWPSFDEG